MTELETAPQKHKKKRKNKKKKKHTFLKVLLFLIGLVVIGLGVFVGAIKFMQPDFDFTTLIPQEVSTFVDEKIMGNTTTTTTTTTTQVSNVVTTTTTTTQPTTSLDELFYLKHSDFSFKGERKGAFIGNLLNGGKVERNGSFVYHVVDGQGIYRVNTSTEAYSRVFKTSKTISCLNIKGEYFYYLVDNTLYRLKIGGSTEKEICKGITFAYIYGGTAYCVTENDEIALVSLETNDMQILYKADTGSQLQFAGISLDGVFFTSTSSTNFVKYLFVDLIRDKTFKFMDGTMNGDVKSLVIENGFMYYYKRTAEDTYDLVRQKVGSPNVVTLVENTKYQLPAVISKNKVFYADEEDGRFAQKEFNMNSKKTKTMISAANVSSADTVIFQHGGEYDFMMGKLDDGSDLYIGTSYLSSSTNVMTFKDGKWKY